MKALARTTYLLLVLISGCAYLGLPTPTTFNERLASAYGTVTTIRQTTTTLLVAKKITADDAQNVQNQADAARSALDVSAAVFKTDPAAGNNKLAATITLLTSLQAYLATKKGSQ
jgi:hypothetical protein